MGRLVGKAPPAPVALAEAKALLRISANDEDALIAGFVRSAAETCEAFTGRMLIAREVREDLRADGAWHRLAAAPVRETTAAATVGQDGSESVLAASDYALDIDAHGEGWIRAAPAAEARVVRATYRAGLAEDWNGIPEPLRQGILRLAAHLYTSRSGEGGPPTAITALWRPWRRMRLR